MTRQKLNARVRLSDRQFEGLEHNTRRDLIKQVMFIRTPTYMYCIGAEREFWTIVRFDIVDAESIDMDSAEVVDKWI